MNNSHKRAHLWISGRVQGVGFRYYVQRTARALSLGGWVRNLPDGRVEAVFEGDEGQVRKAIKACEAGPGTAHVDHVNVNWGEAENGEKEFRIAF